jgi:hypothetical protein
VIRVIAKTTLFLVISLFMAVTCYCEDDLGDEDMRVFDGKVVAVGNSSLTVKGVVEINFPISLDTKFKKDIYDIKLSNVNVGDYVNVEYYRTGSASRVPLRVTKVTVVKYWE